MTLLRKPPFKTVMFKIAGETTEILKSSHKYEILNPSCWSSHFVEKGEHDKFDMT